MLRHYLIDFENVQTNGFKLIPRDKTDVAVHVFYTERSPKIAMQSLEIVNGAKLFFYQVHSGKQSLDMHLISFLGYLIGMDKENADTYTIVSNDTDYVHCALFWNVRLKRFAVTMLPHKQVMENAFHELESENKRVVDASMVFGSRARKEAMSSLTKLGNTVFKELGKVDTENQIDRGAVASLAVRMVREAPERLLMSVYQSLVKKYGRELGLEAYSAIKGTLKMYKEEGKALKNNGVC